MFALFVPFLESKIFNSWPSLSQSIFLINFFCTFEAFFSMSVSSSPSSFSAQHYHLNIIIMFMSKIPMINLPAQWGALTSNSKISFENLKSVTSPRLLLHDHLVWWCKLWHKTIKNKQFGHQVLGGRGLRNHNDDEHHDIYDDQKHNHDHHQPRRGVLALGPLVPLCLCWL